MERLAERLGAVLDASGFSGVVRIDGPGAPSVELARGDAVRSHGVAIDPDTRFGIASGVKGMTALTVVRLVELGALTFTTTARSILGADLPSIGDDVTVEHLLAHRSGIGDYLDEDVLDDITAYPMPVPVHELVDTEDYVRALDGRPPKFAPDTAFSYCNSGYVLLALCAERATGRPFREVLDELVCRPAGMTRTAFERSDELPGDVAVGYLGDGPRTNVFHLPVRGSGDGGIHTCVGDVHAMWSAFLGGRIVSAESVAHMLRPRSDAPEHGRRYGLGFWLHATGDAVILEGYDAGVSFRSVHDPGRQFTWTVVSNTSEGAWPVARAVAEALDA